MYKEAEGHILVINSFFGSRENVITGLIEQCYGKFYTCIAWGENPLKIPFIVSPAEGHQL